MSAPTKSSGQAGDPALPVAVAQIPGEQETSDKRDGRRRPPEESTLRPPLRYPRRSLALLVGYLPILIVPWILTCILAVRPLGLPSYYDQVGLYTPAQYEKTRFWVRFVDVVSAIASILTVPLICVAGSWCRSLLPTNKLQTHT